MARFYLIISLFLLGLGTYHLFGTHHYVMGIHSILIALYAYLVSFELRSRPFTNKLYLLLIGLFLFDAYVQFSYEPTNVIGGCIGLFFAYFSWKSYMRLSS